MEQYNRMSGSFGPDNDEFISSTNGNEEGNHRKAKTSIDTLYEISQILDTGIDKKTLTLCISLCEMGIPPENVAVS